MKKGDESSAQVGEDADEYVGLIGIPKSNLVYSLRGYQGFLTPPSSVRNDRQKISPFFGQIRSMA